MDDRFLWHILSFNALLGACSGLFELTLHNPPSYDYPYLPLLIDIVFHTVFLFLSYLPPRQILPEFSHGQPIKGQSG